MPTVLTRKQEDRFYKHTRRQYPEVDGEMLGAILQRLLRDSNNQIKESRTAYQAWLLQDSPGYPPLAFLLAYFGYDEPVGNDDYNLIVWEP